MTKLRFIFVGFVFAIFIAAILLPLFYITKKIIEPKLNIKKKERTNIQKTQTHILEVIGAGIVLFATYFYALYLFPHIPSNFGGGKPNIVRLIGAPEKIKQLNQLIARETGADFKKLPYELLGKNGNSAIGANVKILDKNSERYFLLLTEDLYLSSSSDFAKKLLEKNTLTIGENKNFNAKPILFSTDGIYSLTTTLYTPPAVTTTEDIKLAARLVAQKPESASAIKSAISADFTSGIEVIEAIEKNAKSEQEKTKNSSGSKAQTQKEIEEIINKTIKEKINEKFLDFREKVFLLTQRIIDEEWYQEKQLSDLRKVLVGIFTTYFSENKIDATSILGSDSYLMMGQKDPSFAKNLKESVRGANDIQTVISRIKAFKNPATATTPESPKTETLKESEEIKNFKEIQTEIMKILVSSDKTDSESNYKIISDLVVKKMTGKSSQYKKDWENPYLLDYGYKDSGFLENLQIIFKNTKSFRELQKGFNDLPYNLYRENVKNIEEAETEEEKKNDDEILDEKDEYKEEIDIISEIKPQTETTTKSETKVETKTKTSTSSPSESPKSSDSTSDKATTDTKVETKTETPKTKETPAETKTETPKEKTTPKKKSDSTSEPTTKETTTETKTPKSSDTPKEETSDKSEPKS